MNKTYRLRPSARCYRYKWEALTNHAPSLKTVYEIVTFDAKGEAQILYVGLAWEKTMDQMLAAHLDGSGEPKVDDLIAKHKDVYFDYIFPDPGSTKEDLSDIQWALIQKNKPLYNKEVTAPSGRYETISLEEAPAL